jgi:uncharacterized surface protein with fasciclin (FAS1) repeats
MTYNPDRRTLLKTLGSAGTLLAVGGVGTAGARTGASAEQNVVETARALNRGGPFAGSFDTLVAAVVEAGLAGALTGNRQLTVFAPTDDAFRRELDIGPNDVGGVDDDLLFDILTYHVSPGRRYAASVLNARTLNGSRIDVETELGGGSAVVATDVEASNGVVHAIDTVLRP